MERNLELRSSYFYEDRGMGAGTFIPRMSSNFQNEVAVAETVVYKNEYAVAVTMAKSIAIALGEDLYSIAQTYTSKRLSSEINNGFKKQNGRLTLAGVSSLDGFEFNSEHKFSIGADMKLCMRKGANKGRMIVHIPAFVPIEKLNIPDEATNFKICARLISLSDFQETNNGFKPIVSDLSGCFGSYESTMLPVLRIQTQPLTAQLAIPDFGDIDTSVATVLVLAVKFYNYSHNKFTFMPDQSMMQIQQVY